MTEEVAEKLKKGSQLALRDLEGVILAVLDIQDIFSPKDKKTQCLGGKIRGLKFPEHYDFCPQRCTPLKLRSEFSRRGWRSVVSYQTDQPMHRQELEMTCEMTRQIQSNLLVQPVVGVSAPEDVDHYSRIKSLLAMMPRYPRNTALLNLLPLPEIDNDLDWLLLRSLVAKNYG